MTADVETIQPVLHLLAAGTCQCLTARQRVRFLSLAARKALAESARLQGYVLDISDLRKADNGAPLPGKGIHWSIAHKPGCVGGVAAPFPIGLDIEEIREPSAGLFRKVAEKRDWELLGGRSILAFFRIWTAKEAVLKAAGVGIAGLSECRVQEVPDADHLIMAYAGKTWRVAHRYPNGHLASIAPAEIPVLWRVADQPDACVQAFA